MEFDPKQVSYRVLVRHFFKMHDPTQLNRQGPDIGDNYRSEIFYTDESQRTIAETEMQHTQTEWSRPIVTKLEPESTFYPAEDYHQKFAERTGRGMCHIPYQSIKE